MPTPTARRVVRGLLVLYLALVARLTLWPAPASPGTFDLVREALDRLEAAGVPLTYDGLEASANVVMFLPFGVLAGLLVRRAWLVVLLGCGLSTAIELAQLAFLPTRFATVQDVVLNTLGAALGVLGLRAVRSVRTRRKSGTARDTTG